MTENKWDISVLRSLTHSLQMPHIGDLRVMTYANIIQSIIPELPENFYIEEVEVLLKKTYGFSNVSKLLISRALLVLSNQKGTSKEEITHFDKSTFTIQVDKKKLLLESLQNY